MKHMITLLILYYLRFWSRLSLSIAKPKVIGIAGSVGKSSTKFAVFAVLKDHFKIKMLEGNSETGIPLSLLGIKPQDYSPLDWLRIVLLAPFGIFHLRGTTHVVAEMGIDHPYPPKNMQYLLTIMKPDIAVSLNISATHTQQFEKVLQGKDLTGKARHEYLLEKIAEEDTRIITDSGCNVAIYNADDSYIVRSLKNKQISATVLTFGKDTTNTISFTDYSVSSAATQFGFQLQYNGEITALACDIKNYLLPEPYREVIAVAILVSVASGIEPKQAVISIEKNFEVPKGRSGLLQGIKETTIIDSSYNASKVAVLTFLDLLYRLKKEEKRKAVFIFGDMRELGDEAKGEHEAVAEKIIEGVDELYLIGPLTKAYVLPKVADTVKKVEWFANAHLLGQRLKENLTENSVVLVKGSQNTIYLEEAIKYILQNKEDEKMLCRQSPSWLKMKESYFKK